MSPTGRLPRVDNDFLRAFHALDANPDKNFAGTPPAKKLSMLLRPTFMAERGRTLVWGDWSNIEARVLPWLAASDGAEALLDTFRESDADDTKPDIYVRTGVDVIAEGPLFGMPAEEVWAIYGDKAHPLNKAAKQLRQAQGKVPVLSLGFGGGLGALQAMASNYGVYFDDAQGQQVVVRWRDANRWAVRFWGAHGRDGSYGLWGAINSAIKNPDTIHEAGRVAYVYDRSYLGGTVFCALPCGRLLTYPAIKWEWREVEDKKTKKLVDRYQLTFLKGYARSALWYGKLAENITQATAASILRRTLKELDRGWTTNEDRSYSRYADFMPVVMHTHDEVVTEVAERDEARARAALKRLMETNRDWDAGLPLAAGVVSNWFYTKAIE